MTLSECPRLGRSLGGDNQKRNSDRFSISHCMTTKIQRNSETRFMRQWVLGLEISRDGAALAVDYQQWAEIICRGDHRNASLLRFSSSGHLKRLRVKDRCCSLSSMVAYSCGFWVPNHRSPR